ncbi:hypothetical protein GCM10008949_37330 [Deinococcus humi]|nr:hypothetical protein GCM10008949_37330 [Deinococcus humi]
MKEARPLLLLLAIFLGWLVISALLTGNRGVNWWGPQDRADGVVMHTVYVVVLLGGWVLVHQLGMRARLLTGLTVAGILLALWSLAQQLGLIGVIGEGAIQGVVATLAGGPMGQRGYMGGLLALLLPLAIITAGRTRMRWWAFAGVVLMTWALAGAYTRGTWLAGIAGVGWLAVWGWRILPKQVWLAVPLGLCLFAGTLALREPVRDFNGAKGLLDGSQRTVLWNSALYGIVQRPIFGWGAPGVWRAMAARPTSELLREQEVTNVVTAQRLPRSTDEIPAIAVTLSDGKRVVVRTPVNKVHNEYLDYALTYGIPAALMFTVLLGWAIWSGRRLAPALSAGLVAYAVYLLTWPEIIRFAPIAWFMMGICLAYGKQSNSSLTVKENP